MLRDALQSVLDEAAHLSGFSENTERKVVAELDGAAENTRKTQFSYQDPRLVLTCAFRYALGRGTYAPGVIVNELRKNWHLLAEWNNSRSMATSPQR